MLNKEDVIETIKANSFNTNDGDNCIIVDDVIEIINDIYAQIPTKGN